MKIRIDRDIHSTVPGAAGLWTMRTEREYEEVPRSGDYIELAPGWSSWPVDYTTFTADGRVVVRLEPMKTDNPDMIEEDHILVQDHGWEWIRKPPRLI
jgi:hypothetical protein